MRTGEGLTHRTTLSIWDGELFASFQLFQLLTADLLTDHLAFVTDTKSARLWLPDLIFGIILITVFTIFRVLCSKTKIKTDIRIRILFLVIFSLSYTNITIPY